MFGVKKKDVRRKSREMLDYMSPEDVDLYFETNCTDEERERIVSAIWEEWHIRNGKEPDDGSVRRFLRKAGELYQMYEE